MTTVPHESTLTRDPQIIELLPAQGDWSEDAYLWLTDYTQRLVEYSDGRIEVLPMPTDLHQSVAAVVFVLLAAYFQPRGGKVLFAPLRVRLLSRRFREPDLVVLAALDDPRRENRFWHGADLVVEVVSEDDPDRDWIIKRHEYAEAGIPEYWIVDPRDETVTVLTLDGCAYREHGRFARGQTATSVRFDGLAAPVADIFDAG